MKEEKNITILCENSIINNYHKHLRLHINILSFFLFYSYKFKVIFNKIMYSLYD